jgi:hypothetical protein
LYIALLYSLSKALLKQAEEEVAAKPSTAYPLARIVIGLVALGHARLGEVFMAKMVAMTGGWAVGVVIRREEVIEDDFFTTMTDRLPYYRARPMINFVKLLDSVQQVKRLARNTSIDSAVS